MNEALRAKKNRVEQLLNQEMPHAELLDEIYLVALARRPTPGESKKLLSELAHAENTDHRELIEDIFYLGTLSISSK